MGLPEQASPITQANYFKNYLPCASRLSAVNATGMQMPILVAAEGIDGHRRGKQEAREEPAKKHQISWVWSISGLMRDGTAEPVSRDHVLRREREQGKVHFPCQAEQRQDYQPYPVDPYSAASACYRYKPCLKANNITFSISLRTCSPISAHISMPGYVDLPQQSDLFDYGVSLPTYKRWVFCRHFAVNPILPSLENPAISYQGVTRLS